MRKTKFTEEQMMDAVQQLEAGRPVKGLARELGITGQTLCHWRVKYSGLDVHEARRLRALEEANRRWKALVADLSLEREAGESSQWLTEPRGVMKIAAWEVRSLGVPADEGALIFS
jgi:putative transposase